MSGNVPAFSATGAPQLRSQLFDALRGFLPQATQSGADVASGLSTAAAAPQWKQAQDLATRTMAGDYLAGSPQLDRAMAANTARTMSSAADQEARLRSQFGKAGMAFSTGDVQASEANRAAAAAGAAGQNAQTYYQNYLAERGAQQQAPQAFGQAQSAPLNYLSQIAGARTAPLSSMGNILSALSSGGQVFNLGGSQVGQSNPSMGSSIMSGIGAL